MGATPWTELTAPATAYISGVGPSVGTDFFTLFLFETGSGGIQATPYTEMSVAATSHTEMSVASTTWTEQSL